MTGLISRGCDKSPHLALRRGCEGPAAAPRSSWKRGEKEFGAERGFFLQNPKILLKPGVFMNFRHFGLSCFFGKLRPRQGFLSNPPNPIFSFQTWAEDAAGDGNGSFCCWLSWSRRFPLGRDGLELILTQEPELLCPVGLTFQAESTSLSPGNSDGSGPTPGIQNKARAAKSCEKARQTSWLSRISFLLVLESQNASVWKRSGRPSFNPALPRPALSLVPKCHIH